MKQWIKNILKKIPGIRGFVGKWLKARVDIEQLQKQSERQNKINARQKKINEHRKKVYEHQRKLNYRQAKINDKRKLQIAALQKKVKVLSKKVEESYAVNESCVKSDLAYIKMMQLERRLAYERVSNNQADVSFGEKLMAGDEEYLRTERPLVSIIILNRNGKKNFEILMNSFKNRRFYNNFEIICVDNASTDDSIEYLETWNKDFDIKVIRNSENMSFSAANNKGVKEAKGQYYLFLNNDTEVTDGWLDELLIAMHNEENPGAIGAKLIYPSIPDGTINAGKSYTVQHDGIAFKDSIREGLYFTQPYNMGNGKANASIGNKPIERACVTAAVLLVSKEAFEAVGGYDEKYIYGYEDVDLCLKLNKAGYKNYYCPNCLVYHYEFGTQSKDNGREVRIRRLHNMNVFKGKWQSYLSRKMLEDKLNATHIFTEEKLVVGLVVTEDFPETTAGDFFTAMELAASLKKLGYEIKYLSRRGKKDWYDVGIEVDVVVALLDAYDITKIYNAKPDVVKIAWARNWFDRWCEREFFEAFDLVFASSTTACKYMEEHSNKKAILFPIATNSDRFNPDSRITLRDEEKDKFTSDYAFTGSYWNVKREIIDYLNPADLPYECKIYGVNWEQIDKFKDCAQGFTLYEDMPKIYQNTKVVIDDANHVTKSYGAVNSRVFDALATGALIITNGVIGAQETFKGLLPCFENEEEFSKKLSYYLENDTEREELVAKLQSYVLENHTYDVRARRLREILLEYNEDVVDDKRIDIFGAMPDDETKKYWGDQHFAVAMKKEFEKLGYKANVVPRDKWFDRSDAKYTIVLRGTKPYYPSVNEGRKYIMWNISHPDELTIDEYNLYDYVFFASERMKNEIGPQITCDSGVLLQCVDDEVMNYEDKDEKEYELLFVGNSRLMFRRILKDLLPTEHKLSVYGREWEEFPVNEYVVSDYIDNDKVGQAYHDAKILLNDHWDDMRHFGIISNRVFDALAVGAFVISDYLPEIEEVFDGAVETYKTKEELKEKIDYYLSNDETREKHAVKGRQIVLEKHTFAVRCKDIVDMIESKM
ncbi:MAG: glycosyltransferase [Lachnospiraceae bacterium]|nr:glycosyltransferase [Lachnospiraceae bacterium]